jgi:hypothetical protein
MHILIKIVTHLMILKAVLLSFLYNIFRLGARGSVVVKALGYKSEGRWFKTR